VDPEDLLAQEREKIFGLYGQAGSFYDNPESQALLAQLQGRASGEAVPFDQQVTSGMYAANADASAGRFGGESDMIRRAFSNAGMGGSGLQAQAMIQSRRKANAATRTGRREITSRAQLENFQARERGQQQVQNFLAQKQQAMQQAQFAEAQARSQQHATGDATNVAQATGTPTAQTQTPSAAPAAAKPDPQVEAMRKRFMGANPFARHIGSGKPGGAQYADANRFGTSFSSGASRLATDTSRWNAQQESYKRQSDDWNRQQANFFSAYGY